MSAVDFAFAQLSKTEKNVLIRRCFPSACRFLLSFLRSLCSQGVRCCPPRRLFPRKSQTSPSIDATPALEIDLNTNFSDPTLPANTVRLTTDLGIIDVALYDQQTPITVANFHDYIDSGQLTSERSELPVPAPIFFHRSVSGFCHSKRRLLSATVNPVDPPVILPGPVADLRSDQERDRAFRNIRGTIAMAKLTDEPDSATSQWFINLVR